MRGKERLTSASLCVSVSAPDSDPARAALAFALSLFKAPLDLAADDLTFPSWCLFTVVPLPFGRLAVAAGMSTRGERRDQIKQDSQYERRCKNAYEYKREQSRGW